ncbi:SGNH/GDSL hydrolase family protein [Nocardioides piscis]|uniref:SGNH/GDSL hydrolase family protein n=1 Tax=Nocardioides piscis TaxID=2714938 RepID=A0A6G7YKS4_9ACTN|nr:SGNH/GDSL hydrolase family protein [Nocardioides piscis]
MAAAGLAAVALTVVPTGSAGAVDPDEYVALGDSYSAGNGAFSNNLGSCFRNTYAYPYLVAQQRANTDLTFVACGGAVTGDVIEKQVPSLSAATDFVTITIGGNDVGFANVIFNCADSWSFNCQNAVNQMKAKITDELPAKLDATYNAIKAKSPNAKVVVLGYSRMFGKSLSCAGANGITAQEATWANEAADLLDATIGARVAAAGSNFVYKSSVQSWAGHEVCTREPWLNGKSWSVADMYHPTRTGYAKGYVPAVRSVIG